MKFNITTKDFAKLRTDCLVLGIYDDGKLTSGAKNVDQCLDGFLKRSVKHADFKGKLGKTMFLQHIPDIVASSILLVGVGKKSKVSATEYQKLISGIIKAILDTNIKSATLFMTELDVDGHDLSSKIKQAILVASDTTYKFDHFKSKKEPAAPLEAIFLHLNEDKSNKECEAAVDAALSIASGVELTKNLANTPSNICTPSYLAKEAKKLAKEHSSLKVKTLEEKDMQKLGMNAFLSVSKGSDKDAKLICMEYKGAAAKDAPFVLIGKGITFDTGGISLKPADAMVGMKYDMCGAATVFGAIKAAAELKLPINLVGLVAAAENMPSGTASKPEDIVTTMSGQTVEIANTDAEGRLVLCDTITYSLKYKPQAVIDIATLTGACIIALGDQATAMLSNDDKLAKDLITSGLKSHDRVWQLPLWPEYQEQLSSPFADMSNIGGRAAGTITAGCFLSRFADKIKWAHLDVAGTAANMFGVKNRYATGRPVPLLMQYLMDQAPVKKTRKAKK